MGDRSFVSSFELIEDNLSPAIVDGVGLSALRDVCAQLPEALATFWGLECRLGEARARADILFEIKRNSPGHRLLRGDETSMLDPLCADFAVWRMLRDFARRWGDAALPGMEGIRNIWLEFDSAAVTDAVEARALIATPSLFWGTQFTAQSKRENLQFLFSEMAKFHGSILVPQYLFDVVRTLPEGAVLFQAGMMISRQQPVVRLCVNKLNGKDTLKWLADIDWPGDVQGLEELFHKLRGTVDNVAVDLDVTSDGIQAKLGLECYRSWDDIKSDQWRALLDMCVEWGLSRGDKADGVLAYPGHKLTLKNNVIGDAVHTHYTMNTHHLKLVARGARVEEAKAYLGLHRPGVRYNAILGDDADGPADGAWLVE